MGAGKGGGPSPNVLNAASSGSRSGGASFTMKVRLVRLVFIVAWRIFAAWTPPQLRSWRRIVLCVFGAKLARTANVYSSAKVWYPPNLTMGDFSTIGPRVFCYNQAPISLGDFAIVSQDATLCSGTHDHESVDFQLITRPIHIGAYAWIAAEAFVGPGVRVGDYAILGARAVAMRNLEESSIYSGNPATFIRVRSQKVWSKQ